MRKLVLTLLALLASGVVAEAQAPVRPNMFPTLASCLAALKSGHVRYYEPRYFGLKTRNPVNNDDRVVVPLETDMCLEMLVVGGRRFIAQREGTLFRAQKRADGSLALYARHDCGNPVYGAVLTPPVQPEPVSEMRESPPVLRNYEPPPPPQIIGPPVWQPSPEPTVSERKGFCRSKKCRFAVLAIGGAAGYATWRVWPCPPGTVRR